MKKIYLCFLMCAISILSYSQTYFPLTSGAFTQNWTDASLITTNDVWNDALSIKGFLGQDLTTATGTNPQTILTGASSVANDLDVNANRADPNVFASGGVAEFDGIPNPTVAFQGSGTGDAPHLIIYLNTTGVNNISVQYNLRDIDGAAENAIQQVALQYRIGNTGNFINIPAGYVADASSGPSLATLVTAVNVTLPTACDNQAQVELRIITSNAAGVDEFIGVDDINVFAGTLAACAEPSAQPTNLVLNATASSVSATFDVVPPTTTIENYLVVRSTDATLTQLPVDGTTYTAGQTLGNGVIVSATSNGTFTNSTSPSTQYYYFVFSIEDQNCSGINYLQTGPLTGSITTPALAACVTPTVPTALMLTPANTSINGTFTGSSASKYLVLISTTTPLSSTPTNGTMYTVGQMLGNGRVVSYSTVTNFLANGLTANTQYYFYVFAANDACTGEPFYSTTSLDGNTLTTNNANNIPAGYYNAAAGLSCAPLKTALNTIITNGHTQNNYGDLDNIQMPTTDDRLNDAGTATIVWDMYSDNPNGVDPYTNTFSQTEFATNQAGEGNGWNKEHSFPNSWFGGGTNNFPGADLFHLYPTDQDVNSLRGNFPYGVVSNATTTTLNGSKLGSSAIAFAGYNGPVFEPIDAYKGDFARSTLYMVTRYQSEQPTWENFQPTGNVVMDGTTYPSIEIDYLNMLLAWHKADPVSQKELDRNDEVFRYQNNRNPFIDRPEYVNMIWSSNCGLAVLPITLNNFTASQSNSNTVNLKWNVQNEVSFKGYIVERSTDGITFNKIGEVSATNSNNYSFNDNNLPNSNVVYYRLKLVDINGVFKLSNTVIVKLNNATTQALVYPNPTKEVVNVRLYQTLFSNSTLQIADVTGRIVKQQTVNANASNISVDIKTLASGRYFIKISNNKQVINQTFVVGL